MPLTSSLLLLMPLVAISRASLYGESNLNHTCFLQPSYRSCSPQAYPNITDSCCTETFGGLVLSTQYWDTYTGLESNGQVLPKDSWTLHGLWPDFCNGSYTQYCDLSRQYDPSPSPNTTTRTSTGTPVPPYTGPSISKFLAPFGKLDLLAYMNKFWVSQGAPNGDFWGHEFSKHGTCFSSFDLPCYGPLYTNHSEVIEFFETALTYYNRLPTFDWLSHAGIRPSNSTTTSLNEVQGALRERFGARPYIGCSGPRFNGTTAGNGMSDNGYTVITEVRYYYHVFGRVQGANGVPVDAGSTGGGVSNCAKAKGALRYLERTAGSEVEEL